MDIETHYSEQSYGDAAEQAYGPEDSQGGSPRMIAASDVAKALDDIEGAANQWIDGTSTLAAVADIKVAIAQIQRELALEGR